MKEIYKRRWKIYKRIGFIYKRLEVRGLMGEVPGSEFDHSDQTFRDWGSITAHLPKISINLSIFYLNNSAGRVHHTITADSNFATFQIPIFNSRKYLSLNPIKSNKTHEVQEGTIKAQW
jgi:hypothetical protein